MKTASRTLFVSFLLSASMLTAFAQSAEVSSSPSPHVATNQVVKASAAVPPAGVTATGGVATPPVTKLATEEVRVQASPSFERETSPWWEGKLVLGARMHWFQLADTRRTSHGRYSNSNVRGNFIGSIWGLDENQEYLPRLNLSYWFTPNFGLGLTYDQVSAKTVDWGNLENTVTGSDGDVNVWGPMIYLSGRWPNSTKCTPFAELGLAQYYASFDESVAWQSTAPGYRFEVDNTSGYYWGLGLDFELNSKWSVDVYWRQMNNAEVDARAYFSTSSKVGRYGTFPMDYDMYGIGLNYHF